MPINNQLAACIALRVQLVVNGEEHCMNIYTLGHVQKSSCTRKFYSALSMLPRRSEKVCQGILPRVCFVFLIVRLFGGWGMTILTGQPKEQKDLSQIQSVCVLS